MKDRTYSLALAERGLVYQRGESSAICSQEGMAAVGGKTSRRGEKKMGGTGRGLEIPRVGPAALTHAPQTKKKRK